MKKEYIMSDEDKEQKRMKIEQNRAKRRLSTNITAVNEEEIHSKKVIKTRVMECESPDVLQKIAEIDDKSPIICHSNDITGESSPKDIVDCIVMSANARQTILNIMKTQKDAVHVMGKIIQSPDDALKLIGHFISNPAVALVIISQIMDSPLDALSVFTKFMSSTTDALSVSNVSIYLSLKLNYNTIIL